MDLSENAPKTGTKRDQHHYLRKGGKYLTQRLGLEVGHVQKCARPFTVVTLRLDHVIGLPIDPPMGRLDIGREGSGVRLCLMSTRSTRRANGVRKKRFRFLSSRLGASSKSTSTFRTKGVDHDAYVSNKHSVRGFSVFCRSFLHGQYVLIGRAIILVATSPISLGMV